MELGKVDYGKLQTPNGYKCSKCGAQGVKLWRQYQTCASAIDLLCAVCACADQDKQYSVDETGHHTDEFGQDSDQIGWLVPAVPTDDGTTFWGYTSTPSAGSVWWFLLPVRLTENGFAIEPSGRQITDRLRRLARNSDTVYEMNQGMIREYTDTLSAIRELVR